MRTQLHVPLQNDDDKVENLLIGNENGSGLDALESFWRWQRLESNPARAFEGRFLQFAPTDRPLALDEAEHVAARQQHRTPVRHQQRGTLVA